MLSGYKDEPEAGFPEEAHSYDLAERKSWIQLPLTSEKDVQGEKSVLSTPGRPRMKMTGPGASEKVMWGMRSLQGEGTWETSPRGWNAQAWGEDLEWPGVQEIRKERGERYWASPQGAWAASSSCPCLYSALIMLLRKRDLSSLQPVIIS